MCIRDSTCSAITGLGAPLKCSISSRVVSRTGEYNLFAFHAVATDVGGLTTVKDGFYRVREFFIAGVQSDSRGIYHLKYGFGYSVIAQVGSVRAPQYFYARPAGRTWGAVPREPGPFFKYIGNGSWLQSIHMQPIGMRNGQLWNIGVRTTDGVMHVLHIVVI